MLSGQGKTTITVYLCIRSAFRSRQINVNCVCVSGVCSGLGKTTLTDTIIYAECSIWSYNTSFELQSLKGLYRHPVQLCTSLTCYLISCHSRKTDILDNMMAIMEKYANNLEEIVEDRTAQLVEEKKKTDNLLHRMLPK